MSNPYYAVATYAARTDDDALRIGVGVSLVHPLLFDNAEALALESAKLQYPTSEGWENHYVRVEPLDRMLVDTIAAEHGLAVPDNAIVATILTSRWIEPDIEDEA